MDDAQFMVVEKLLICRSTHLQIKHCETFVIFSSSEVLNFHMTFKFFISREFAGYDGQSLLFAGRRLTNGSQHDVWLCGYVAVFKL